MLFILRHCPVITFLFVSSFFFGAFRSRKSKQSWEASSILQSVHCPLSALLSHARDDEPPCLFWLIMITLIITSLPSVLSALTLPAFFFSDPPKRSWTTDVMTSSTSIGSYQMQGTVAVVLSLVLGLVGRYFLDQKNVSPNPNPTPS